MERTDDKIREYLKNNELNIEQVISDYSNYIRTIIHNSGFVLSKEDEEEIILDVYLALWNNTQRLDINKSMSNYIAGITKNLIMKKCKGKNQLENIEDYVEYLHVDQNIEIDFIESQKNQVIINELENMKKIDKDIFIYYYYEQRKVKDIAAILDISESKVKTKLFRIRKKLNKILKKEGMK
ncbi:MAG: sigma-70 family RNA polymerase sigma factor [Clostridia bacterium]|nr:sigma-70 family RNA polymerase sigma factor [Clostridia bacterium]